MTSIYRKTIYTIHKRLDFARYLIARRRDGKYLNHAYAARAIRRLGRWMVANPQAKTNRAAPFHIIRNAAVAQLQIKGAKH